MVQPFYNRKSNFYIKVYKMNKFTVGNLYFQLLVEINQNGYKTSASWKETSSGDGNRYPTLKLKFTPEMKEFVIGDVSW